MFICQLGHGHIPYLLIFKHIEAYNICGVECTCFSWVAPGALLLLASLPRGSGLLFHVRASAISDLLWGWGELGLQPRGASADP